MCRIICGAAYLPRRVFQWTLRNRTTLATAYAAVSDRWISLREVATHGETTMPNDLGIAIDRATSSISMATDAQDRFNEAMKAQTIHQI